MILGEMYGIRAMMHFDLLRLFAPAPVTNPTGLANALRDHLSGSSA